MASDESLSTDVHEGHGPGQCRPGCPVWDTKSVAWQVTQMDDAELLRALARAVEAREGR